MIKRFNGVLGSLQALFKLRSNFEVSDEVRLQFRRPVKLYSPF